MATPIFLRLYHVVSENLASQSGIKPMPIQNPYKFLSRCDVFICSSYSEGFSTALSEAVILGLPCISTDVSGAAEILGENGEYGIITENSEEGVFKSMKQILSNERLLDELSKKAESRASYFSPERTVKAVEELIESVAQK